jgi:hypothetical protein
LAYARTYFFPVSWPDGLNNYYAIYLDGDPASVLHVPPAASLDAPSNLSVERLYPDGKLEFYLHWQDNSDAEEYFRITINATDGSGGSIRDASRNAVVAPLTSVACGKTYNISVQAVNGSTVSSPSPIVQAAGDPCPPAAPTGLTATPDGHGPGLRDDVLL